MHSPIVSFSICCFPPQIPLEFDIDSDPSNDHTYTPEYAKDIFDYLKNREVS